MWLLTQQQVVYSLRIIPSKFHWNPLMTAIYTVNMDKMLEKGALEVASLSSDLGYYSHFFVVQKVIEVGGQLSIFQLSVTTTWPLLPSGWRQWLQERGQDVLNQHEGHVFPDTHSPRHSTTSSGSLCWAEFTSSRCSASVFPQFPMFPSRCSLWCQSWLTGREFTFIGILMTGWSLQAWSLVN